MLSIKFIHEIFLEMSKIIATLLMIKRCGIFYLVSDLRSLKKVGYEIDTHSES